MFFSIQAFIKFCFFSQLRRLKAMQCSSRTIFLFSFTILSIIYSLFPSPYLIYLFICISVNISSIFGHTGTGAHSQLLATWHWGPPDGPLGIVNSHYTTLHPASSQELSVSCDFILGCVMQNTGVFLPSLHIPQHKSASFA